MGWIKIDRNIVNHWLWYDEKKLKWWLTILMEVNYTDKVMSLGYKTYHVKRGQSSKSIRSWATVFNTGTKSVLRFFDMLENENLVKRETIGKGKHSTTLLTVCKYASYEIEPDQTETLSDTKESTQEDTLKATQEGYNIRKEESKEGKKEEDNTSSSSEKSDNIDTLATPKNVSKTNKRPTKDLVIEYFVENGYSQQAAERAFDYYESGTEPSQIYWRDSRGNIVKNWKQKMRGVWFKEENKVDDSVPVLEEGWVFVSLSQAKEIVKGDYPAMFNDAKKNGKEEMLVKKIMDSNPSYIEVGDGKGWKYKKR